MCFGVMLVMGGVISAQEQPLEPDSPDMVFPENEPPFMDSLPPIEFPVASTDPDSVFPDEEPPVFVLMPPVEFPEAPACPEEDGYRIAGPPLYDPDVFNPDLFAPDESRMTEYTMPLAIPVVPKDGDIGE